MPDYSNSSVYKIVCKDKSVTDCYVGSTCNLRQRTWAHRGACNNPRVGTRHHCIIYMFIRAHGGWENWTVVEVEKCSCESVEQLIARENHWIEQCGATLNIATPGQNVAEDKYIQYYNEKRKVMLNQLKLI
jgi:hypothetical protein